MGIPADEIPIAVTPQTVAALHLTERVELITQPETANAKGPEKLP